LSRRMSGAAEPVAAQSVDRDEDDPVDVRLAGAISIGVVFRGASRSDRQRKAGKYDEKSRKNTTIGTT